MALIDGLKRQLEHAQNLLTEIDEKRAKLNADYHEQWHYVADLDTAIAALEPAPDITFNDIEPVSEPEPEPSLFDEGAIDILTALPAEQEPDVVFAESGLHGEGEIVSGEQLAEDMEQPTELDAEPISILDNPELLAAVERAQQTLAAEPANYVGLNDPELDAEYDAMRARERSENSYWLSWKRKVDA